AGRGRRAPGAGAGAGTAPLGPASCCSGPSGLQLGALPSFVCLGLRGVFHREVGGRAHSITPSAPPPGLRPLLPVTLSAGARYFPHLPPALLQGAGAAAALAWSPLPRPR
ncbi:hypothetical protein P7K49_018774, partial [Saguinus oedipus]